VGANEALDSIVKKCLRIEPHQRYAKISNLLADLRRWKPTRRREGVLQLEDLATKEFNVERKDPEETTPSDAKDLLKAALALANEQRLDEAADKLEEAIRLQPDLRTAHAGRVALWRKGLSS
jgi:tetratricopeptide (TPR) repeat protein